MTRTFPEAFFFGVATAGHQNEGFNTHSDTWFLEHVSPTVFREPSGAACGSWDRWQEDLDLVAGMGLTAFRFSVEWARVEPEEGAVDQAALDHYDALVDGCVERGLSPIVTYNHFTSPHWFAARAGWLDPAAPDLFARHCERVTRRLGDRTAYAVTFNEPDLPHMLSWLDLPPQVRELERATLLAAAESTGVDRYRAANVMMPEDFDPIGDGMTAGHRAAREAIASVRGDLPVGLSLAIVDDAVIGDDTSVRDRKREQVYARWLELARDDDFIGVQNYERRCYDAQGEVSLSGQDPDSQMGTPIEPESLAGAVRYVHDQTGIPVIVTEHGVATDDDSQRAAFVEPSLGHLLDAMDDGVPVLGYCHWTLLDNFEWIFGYDMHLGLHAVDRQTLDRTPKPSAAAYAEIARSRAIR